MVKVVTGGDVHLHKTKVNKESRVVDLLHYVEGINNKVYFSTRYKKGFDGVQSEKILYKNNEKLLLAANILALLQIIPFILQLLLVLVNMTKYNTLEEESDVSNLT